MEMENKRKLLYPEAKKARRNKDNKVRLIKDKLFVNGVEVTIEPTQQSDENKQSHHSRDQSLRRMNKTVSNQGGWQYRGRGRGRPRGRGQASDRGQNAGGWTAHSSPWTTRDRAFELPTRNRFAPMSRCDDEDAETPSARNPRKHQASSPLDADVNLKKHKEDSEADHSTAAYNQNRSNEQTLSLVHTASSEMVVDTNIDKEVSTSHPVCGQMNPNNPQRQASASYNSPPFDGPDKTQSGSAKTAVKNAHVVEQSQGENWDEQCGGGHINRNNCPNATIVSDKNNPFSCGKNKLNILSLNVCGLSAKLRCPEFCDFLNQYEIIGLQESKTDDTDSIVLPGYTCFLNNRDKLSRYRSGGIALFVKNSISDYVKVENEFHSKLILWFIISHKITLIGEDVHCGIVYIPPQGSKYAHEEPYNELEQEIIRYCINSTNIILMGDFNSRSGQKDDYV